MNVESHDVSSAEFNSNIAITHRVDQLTNDSINALYALEIDGVNASKAIRLLTHWWNEVNAVASRPGNENICPTEVTEIKTLFAELNSRVYHELKRAHPGFEQTRGATKDFADKCYRLKELLQIVGQRFGFGMSVNAYGHYADESFSKALK